MPNAYEIVTDRLIAKLESGIIPWKQPWKNTARGSHLPCNFATGRGYRGINSIMLLCSGFQSVQWMTYKQAANIGAQKAADYILGRTATASAADEAVAA